MKVIPLQGDANKSSAEARGHGASSVRLTESLIRREDVAPFTTVNAAAKLRLALLIA
jgi:hypothetical protein